MRSATAHPIGGPLVLVGIVFLAGLPYVGLRAVADEFRQPMNGAAMERTIFGGLPTLASWLGAGVDLASVALLDSARLLDWGAHTVDLCQWANQADDTMPLEYEPSDQNVVCRYKNGVKLVLDFLPEAFGNRDPHYITRLGTCPVRFVGDEGWVETGDSGEIVVKPESLQGELPEKSKRVNGLDVGAHARNFFDCIRTQQPTAANPDVMRRSHIACHAAALAWVLGRKLTLDPAKEEFVGDAEANLLRARGTRDWAA